MPKILLVEDNELNRDMLSRRLARRGYVVVSATDGEEGHTMACAHRPDLILMDIGLPGMDGWQVTQLLKSNPQTSGIPIIALTAHALVTDRDRARAVGCDDYDTKPVDFARLSDKIEALLSRGVGV
jgi:two-component system cell cycle response regulator DivK